MLASRAMRLPKLPVPYIMLLPNKLPQTSKNNNKTQNLKKKNLTNFCWSCDLKQYTFIISQNFCWSEICNCLSYAIWLQNSHGIQSNFGWVFKHLKAWLRLEGPLPRWLAGWWRGGYLSSPSMWAPSQAVWASTLHGGWLYPATKEAAAMSFMI